MKNILAAIIILFVINVSYSQVTPIVPMNLPEVYDNSIPLPTSAEQGYNMFTDNTITTLKPAYADKIKLIKDYEVKVNDYIVETAKIVQDMAAANDPTLRDTTMDPLLRNIKAVNLEMNEIFMLELSEIGTAQAQFTEELKTITDNREKIRRLNAYTSGKYAELTNKYNDMYREKIVTIYALYQESDFAAKPVNPITRVNIASSLFATLEAFVNHKNTIAKATAERLAKDYMAYKD